MLPKNVKKSNIVVPDFILYAQHGWADTHEAIAILAHTLATPNTLVITPNLGSLKTWLWIEPLIKQVEQSATQTINTYPQTPIKIIGHSLGGLIWLEVLKRHPEWWSKIHSLVLLGSPVGGADLARMIDPLGIGIGIARDLGKNRRSIAESIAKIIPTLVLAGDVDDGSDGIVTVETTKLSGSKFLNLPSVFHSALRNHPRLRKIILDFWANPVLTVAPEPDFPAILIKELRSVTGITDAHRRYFDHSQPSIIFNNGIVLRTWKNFLQIDHVFVANLENECLWGGFVGWIHAQALGQTLNNIRQKYYSLIAEK